MQKEQVLEICKKCKTSCCKMSGVEFTKEEMQKVIDAGYPDHFIKTSENHYEVKTNNATCPYFSENKSCTIHELRPAICRVWPIYPECKKMEKETAYYLIECPLTKVLTQEEIQELKKEAEKIPKEILVGAYSHSTLPEEELNKGYNRFMKYKKRKL